SSKIAIRALLFWRARPCHEAQRLARRPRRRVARSARDNTECPQPHFHDRAGNQAPAAGDGKGDRKREDVNPLYRHEPHPFSPRDLSHNTTPRATTSLIKG